MAASGAEREAVSADRQRVDRGGGLLLTPSVPMEGDPEVHSLRPSWPQDSKHQVNHSQIRLGEKGVCVLGGSGYKQHRASGLSHQGPKWEEGKVLMGKGLDMYIHLMFCIDCWLGGRQMLETQRVLWCPQLLTSMMLMQKAESL